MKKKTNKYKKIAIIGLGYVGLPLALSFSKYFKVVGFDINFFRIKELKSAYDRTDEFKKLELKKFDNIVYSSKEEDIVDSDFFIITVPTPVDKSNKPNLKPIIQSSKTVAKYLKKDSTVIYESTVYPGLTEEICVPIIEKISGLKCNFGYTNLKNDYFHLGYSPERINPGDKKRKLENINKIVSGSNKYAVTLIKNIYKKIIKANIYITPNIKVAEAAKVIENSQRDLNIAFVNELSQMFSLLNIDTHEVLKAARTKWNFLNFQPGLVGGHCIGVDPFYLTHKANLIGFKPKVITSGRRTNDEMPKFLSKLILKKIKSKNIKSNNFKIGVMGLTFKENCSDVRNSKVVNLIIELSSWCQKVVIWDPIVKKKLFKEEYNKNIDNLKDFKNLDCIILAVPHNCILKKSLNSFRMMCKTKKKPYFMDLKSKLSKEKLEKLGFETISI